MLKEWELKELRRLNIVYDNVAKFHALPYGKSKDTGMTEFQLAQALLGYSAYRTRKKVREYLNLLDKTCVYED